MTVPEPENENAPGSEATGGEPTGGEPGGGEPGGIPPGLQEPPRVPACRAAWELTRRFLSEPLSAGQQARLRTHLDDCDACHRRYLVGARTTASLGHRRRVERQREGRARRRQVQRRLAFSGGDAPLWKVGRRWRLRTLLMPALVVFLILQVSNLGGRGPGARLEWREGRVMVSEQLLESDDPGYLLVDEGIWCATADGSRARLFLPEAIGNLGPRTGLWVEEILPPRLRLYAGTLEIAGPCTLTSAHGVVEVERGRARLECGGRRLTVTCLDGRVVAIDAGGETRLGAGESAVMGATGGS